MIHEVDGRDAAETGNEGSSIDLHADLLCDSEKATPFTSGFQRKKRPHNQPVGRSVQAHTLTISLGPGLPELPNSLPEIEEASRPTAPDRARFAAA